MDIVDADRQGADQPGTVAELAGGNRDRIQHAGVEPVLDRGDQLGPHADAAAQHDHLRIDHGGHADDGQRQQPRRVVDHLARRRVGRKTREQVAHGHARLAAFGLVALQDAGRADRGLQRPVQLACPIERIAAERQVGDLAGRAAGATQQLAAGHDAHAQAGAHGDIGKIVDATRPAKPAFTQGGDVDVVLDDHIGAKTTPQQADHIDPVEFRDVRRKLNRAGRRLDHAWRPEHHQPDPIGRDAGVRRQARGERQNLRDDRLPAPRRRGFGTFRDHGAGQVRDRHAQLTAAQVDAGDKGRLWSNFVRYRGSSNRPLSLAVNLHPGRLKQLTHDVGGRLLREARQLGDLHP